MVKSLTDEELGLKQENVLRQLVLTKRYELKLRNQNREIEEEIYRRNLEKVGLKSPKWMDHKRKVKK